MMIVVSQDRNNITNTFDFAMNDGDGTCVSIINMISKETYAVYDNYEDAKVAMETLEQFIYAHDPNKVQEFRFPGSSIIDMFDGEVQDILAFMFD